MKFTGRFDWKPVKTIYTIEALVKGEIRCSDRRGTVEQLEDRLEKLTQVVVAMLEQAPVETQVRVADILGYNPMEDTEGR